MTRERALELTDRLLADGYRCKLLAVPPSPGFLHLSEDPADPKPSWSVEIAELGVDKVDVRRLVEIADELGLDCGFHSLAQGFAFSEPDARPEVVRMARRHPR